MSLRIVDLAGNILGVLELPGTVLLADLEALRRIGAHRIELVTLKINQRSSE